MAITVKITDVDTRSAKIGRGVKEGCALSLILFNLYSECLAKEALE
jgi:hypothetical protein